LTNFASGLNFLATMIGCRIFITDSSIDSGYCYRGNHLQWTNDRNVSGPIISLFSWYLYNLYCFIYACV